MEHDWSKEDFAEYRKKLVRESVRKRRELARANGMCVVCCSQKARKGKKTCFACSAKISARGVQRRKENIKAGMCSVCGKVPPKEGCKRCQRCIDMAYGYAHKWLEGKDE